MRGHEAGADDRLAVTDGGVDGGGREDTLLVETLGKGEGLRLAADEDGDDRGLRRTDLEADRLEPLVHLAGVLPELVDPLGFGLHDLERLEHSADDGRSERGGEDEAAGLVLEELDHLGGAGHKSAH